MTRIPAALAGCAALVAGCTSPAPAVRGRPDPAGVRKPPASSSTVVVDPPQAATTVEPVTEAPTTAPTTTVVVQLPHATTTTTLTLPERSDEAIGDVEWLVRQTFPEDPDRAVRIATRESGLQPGASNGQYAGVMQIGTTTHAALIAAMGYSTADMYHAAPNLAVARRLFDAAGWSPWA